MRITRIIESRDNLHFNVYNATDALNASDEPRLEDIVTQRSGFTSRLGRARGLHNWLRHIWAREEVHNIQHAFLLQVAGLEDVAVGQVLLLSCDILALPGSDGEVAAFVLV